MKVKYLFFITLALFAGSHSWGQGGVLPASKAVLEGVGKQVGTNVMERVITAKTVQNIQFQNQQLIRELLHLQENSVLGQVYPQLLPSAAASMILQENAFALRNNKILLHSLQSLDRKAFWIRQHENIVHTAMEKRMSPWIFDYMATKLETENLVFIGDDHSGNVQQAVRELILAIAKHQPYRQIVLFSEFDIRPTDAKNSTWYTYYHLDQGELPSAKELQKLNRYASEVTLPALQIGAEVYGLEDYEMLRLAEKEVGPDGPVSDLALLQRNRYWARVMRQVMEKVRNTPAKPYHFYEPLFIVYAGTEHISRMRSGSLPGLFGDEKSSVVALGIKELSFQFGLSYLIHNPLPSDMKQPVAFFWNEQNRHEMARRMGYDFAVIIPDGWKQVEGFEFDGIDLVSEF